MDSVRRFCWGTLEPFVGVHGHGWSEHVAAVIGQVGVVSRPAPVSARSHVASGKRWWAGCVAAVALVGVCAGCGSADGSHGAGDNVASAATVTALDLATGQQRWQSRPPAVIVDAPQVHGVNVRWSGIQSRSSCDVHTVTIEMNTRTGRIGSVTAAPDADGAPFPTSTVEQGVTVSYHDPAPGTVSARRGSGFPPKDLQADQSLDDSPGQTGIVATDGTSRILWADVIQGDDGPALLDVPVHGDGVVAANYLGGNHYSGTKPQAVLLLDVRTGAVLWRVEHPASNASIAIERHHAYVLDGDGLASRDTRTGQTSWTVQVNADSLAVTAGKEVVWTTDGHVEAFDGTGRRLWSSRQTRSDTAAPPYPITIANGLVIVSTAGRYATICNN